MTNLAPNHLDVHKDMAEYIAAKQNVYLHQSKADKLVVNMDNAITDGFAESAPGTVEKFSRLGRPERGVWLNGDTIYRNDTPIMKAADIRIPGVHNIENYMAAAWCCRGSRRRRGHRRRGENLPRRGAPDRVRARAGRRQILQRLHRLQPLPHPSPVCAPSIRR